MPEIEANVYTTMVQQAHPSFFREWNSTLRKSGLSDKFGLAILDSVPRLAYETPLSNKRINVVTLRPGSVPFNYVPTIWRVDNTGGPQVEAGCACNCIHGCEGAGIVNGVCTVCGTSVS